MMVTSADGVFIFLVKMCVSLTLRTSGRLLAKLSLRPAAGNEATYWQRSGRSESMFTLPTSNILLTVSIGIPCSSVISVANVCLAVCVVKGKEMPARSRRAFKQV